MKKKRTIFFTLKAIVLGFILSIHSCDIKAQGKFCFTPSEMDQWIKSALNEKAYKRAYDSMVVISRLDSLTILNFVALDTKAQKYEKKTEKALTQNKVALFTWKGICGAIASLWIYREYKQLINN